MPERGIEPPIGEWPVDAIKQSLLPEGEGQGEISPNDSRVESLNRECGAGFLPLLAKRGEGRGEEPQGTGGTLGIPFGKVHGEGEPRLITKRRVIPFRSAIPPAAESSRHVVPRRPEFRNSRARWAFAFLLLFTAFSFACLGDDTNQTPTNSFPTPYDVFQGRQFPSEWDRDIFFMHAIHDRYPSQWPALLDANVTVQDYVQSPAKLMRFINELAIAMRDLNDPVAIASLSQITSKKDFFANTNAYRPEIVQAAAEALIAIGPNGRMALAASFNQDHYRIDSESLENLAKTIAKEKPDDAELAKALAATAFDFTTANGGTYPRCTTEMVKDLLCLPQGASAVRAHLKTDEITGDPARFQSVIDGISAAHAAELSTNLTSIEPGIKTKLDTLTNSPGDYRDDLQDLHNRIQKTIATLENSNQTPAKP